MGNCLVTKLKGTVNADLPVYDEMSFDIPANTPFTSFFLGCCVGNNVIKCTGDVEGWNYLETTKQLDSETPYVVVSNPSDANQIKIKSGENGGRLIINGKYSMKVGNCDGWFKFKPTYFDTLDGYKFWFKGNGTITVTSNTAHGSLEDLAGLVSGISILSIRDNTLLSGSITELSSHKETITDIIIAAPNNGIEASMEDLGVFTGLTTLADYRVIQCNIEDFVRSLIANGKETGSINATFAPGHKFNGVNVEQSASALTWTATTATYKGVTVNL